MSFRSSGSTDSEESTDSDEEDDKRDPFKASNPNNEDRMEVDTGLVVLKLLLNAFVFVLNLDLNYKDFSRV